MNLSGFAVNRPIAVFMLFIGIAIFGVIGLAKLPVDLMPSFEFPMVSVITYYLGAGSEDIETNVTETIEDALSTISGVEHVDSVSQNNLSVVSVQFAFGTDLSEAASDIREQLDALANDLPKDIEPPVLVKMSSASIPILVMGATAAESYPGLRHIMKNQVADPLKAVPGVAEVMVIGGPEREIEVRLDPRRLEATGISMDQVGILGNISYDAHTGPGQRLIPRRLRRADELYKVHTPARKRAPRLAKRPGLDAGCVNRAGVELDDIVMVAVFDLGAVGQSERDLLHFIQLPASIIGQQTASLTCQLPAQGGIGDLNPMRREGRERREGEDQ